MVGVADAGSPDLGDFTVGFGTSSLNFNNLNFECFTLITNTNYH